jgi:5-methylcytosine-specific restriction endonuclease McrA
MASIQKEFISLLEEIGKKRGFRSQKYESKIRKTGNIIELYGSINCLLYYKIRSEEPYRWGVTRNRIEELQNSGKRWFVLLLFETPDKGYLLTSQEVERYTKENLWPLGRGKNKNEYKINTGKTLQYNEPFHTIGDFISSMKVAGKAWWVSYSEESYARSKSEICRNIVDPKGKRYVTGLKKMEKDDIVVFVSSEHKNKLVGIFKVDDKGDVAKHPVFEVPVYSVKISPAPHYPVFIEPVDYTDLRKDLSIFKYGGYKGGITVPRKIPVEDIRRIDDFCNSLGIAPDSSEPPTRIPTTVYRILRDTKKARALKVRYVFKCQVCGMKIELNGKGYVEVHHLQPLGTPHNGRDIEPNMIILCPNHHVMFDYGELAIDPKDSITVINSSGISIGKITSIPSHAIVKEYIKYHHDHIFKK